MEILSYKIFPEKILPYEDFGPVAEDLSSKVINFLEVNGLQSICSLQLGYARKWFVMLGEPSFVCFNPQIVSTNEEEVFMEEGCPSYPGLVVKIKRPSQVRLRFQVPSGLTTTKVFDGYSARLIQHQVDKLEGRKFYDKANWANRSRALKKWKK